MIDTDKYKGHTPADQWTTYEMGAGNPRHAVRFGQRGLDLELKFGADARLIADAPLLLAEVMRLRGLLREVADAYAEGNEEQVETLAYNLASFEHEIYGDFGEDEEE